MSFAPPDPAGRSTPPPGPATTHDATTGSEVATERDGDLTTSWRVIVGSAWALALCAYAGVWQASVQIGIGTWWLGPRAQPTDAYVRFIPFLVPLVVIVALSSDARHPARISIVGSVVAGLISVPDFSRSVLLGATEASIAVLLLVVGLAALTGRSHVPR